MVIDYVATATYIPWKFLEPKVEVLSSLWTNFSSPAFWKTLCTFSQPTPWGASWGVFKQQWSSSHVCHKTAFSLLLSLSLLYFFTLSAQNSSLFLHRFNVVDYMISLFIYHPVKQQSMALLLQLHDLSETTLFQTCKFICITTQIWILDHKSTHSGHQCHLAVGHWGSSSGRSQPPPHTYHLNTYNKNIVHYYYYSVSTAVCVFVKIKLFSCCFLKN